MMRTRSERTILNSVLAVTGFFLFLMAWSIPVEAASPISMKFASSVGNTHHLTPIMQEWMKELEKASKGTVTITYLAAETVGKTPEYAEMVKAGLVDIAPFSTGYNPAHFQLSAFPELPFVSTSSRLSFDLVQELLDKNLITSEFSEYKLLLHTMHAPIQLFASKQISKVEDFKGLRIFCHGPVWNKSMGLLGAQCVAMGMPDAYLALQRGTLDAVPNTFAIAWAWKFQEVVKYPIEISMMGGYLNVFLMNKNSWNKLSPEVQAVWMAINKKFAARFRVTSDNSEDSAKKDWAKMGKPVETFPAAEKEKLAKKLEPVWIDWIDRMEKAGKPGKEIYRTYVNFMKKNNEPVVVKLPGLYQ